MRGPTFDPLAKPRMNITAVIYALPVGEFDSDPLRREFEAMIEVFNYLDAEVIVSDPVSSVEEARQSAWSISEKNPDPY